jgi:exosortase/archaeosortase family protein
MGRIVAGLLVGHLFLRSLRAKVGLTLPTIPVAMFTNAVRIGTLWFLATKIDIGFLYGNLHRNGGIVFSLVSLSVLSICLFLLRKLEAGSWATGRRTRLVAASPLNQRTTTPGVQV